MTVTKVLYRFHAGDLDLWPDGCGCVEGVARVTCCTMRRSCDGFAVEVWEVVGAGRPVILSVLRVVRVSLFLLGEVSALMKRRWVGLNATEGGRQWTVVDFADGGVSLLAVWSMFVARSKLRLSTWLWGSRMCCGTCKQSVKSYIVTSSLAPFWSLLW